jgi:hypothetical protein
MASRGSVWLDHGPLAVWLSQLIKTILLPPIFGAMALIGSASVVVTENNLVWRFTRRFAGLTGIILWR